MRRITSTFADILTRDRHCYVTQTRLSDHVVSPRTGCRRESFIIGASRTIPSIIMVAEPVEDIFDSIVTAVLHATAEMVPFRCQVWLFWADVIINEISTPPAYVIRSQVRLHTDVWTKLCDEFPFLTVEEVVKLSLLPPEKRRLCILGRRIK